MGAKADLAPHGPKNGVVGPPAWPADKVERWPLDRLTPYARNARTHSGEQVEQIAAAIREWGWTNPVLVDEAGGIIAGHGRVLAARKLGLTDAPVMVARGWSAAQKRAYVIADNQLALNAGWDQSLLRLEVADLAGMGFDLPLIGFSADDLATLAPEPLSKYPQLPSGNRAPFQQMTFTLHDEQVEVVKAALRAAIEAGPFEASPNENSNGNALARICEGYQGRAD